MAFGLDTPRTAWTSPVLERLPVRMACGELVPLAVSLVDDSGRLVVDLVPASGA